MGSPEDTVGVGLGHGADREQVWRRGREVEDVGVFSVLTLVRWVGIVRGFTVYALGKDDSHEGGGS